MTGRRRVPSAAEKALWRFAMRDAVPLPGRALPPEPAPVPEAAPAEKPALQKPEPRRPRASAQPIALPRLGTAGTPGLDTRSAERLKRGQLPIDGRLDLHGMTQENAHAALDHFIGEAYATGKRALLIITGKGLKPREPANPWEHGTGGVLKAMTPRWLNEAPNRARILAITEAQPRHGGSGALYVLIRRHRE
jgi:DNA-nicking Smr family endonuclease